MLAFPEVSPTDPIRCPVCNTRFMMEGKRLAHLSFRDYYSLLDIHPGADDKIVGKAVRAKVLEFHPDRNPEDPNAEEKIRDVIQAKELLTDKARRRTYDRVFFARTLPKWTPSQRRQSGKTGPYVRADRSDPFAPNERQPGYRAEQAGNAYSGTGAYSGRTQDRTGTASAGETRESRGREFYEQMMSSAQERSNRMAGHGVDQILREMELRDWMGRLGAGIGCILGASIGLLLGKFWGLLILGLIGTILGRIFGTYGKELVLLLLFILRAYVVGYILELFVVAFQLGGWQPETLKGVFGAMLLKAVIGALALGIIRIGSAALMGRFIRFAEVGVLLQAATGAWLGALVGLILLLIGNIEGDRIPLYTWFILFTIYLLIDTAIFARPVIIVLQQRYQHYKPYI